VRNSNLQDRPIISITPGPGWDPNRKAGKEKMSTRNISICTICPSLQHQQKEKKKKREKGAKRKFTFF